MTRSRNRGGVALAALLALAPPAGHARAAEVTVDGANAAGDVLALRGSIVVGDAGRLREAIAAANHRGRRVGALRLDSPGGVVTEAVELAQVARAASLPTVVVNGGICASACFVVFAGGSPRYASRSARIGVHSASERGTETQASSTVTLGLARFLHDLDVPDSILGRMTVTLPGEMAWLGEADLRSMGVVLTGRPDQSAALTSREAPAIAVPERGDARPLTIRGARRVAAEADVPPAAPAGDGVSLARYDPGSGPPARRFGDFGSGPVYDGPVADAGFGPAGSPFHADASAISAAVREGPNFASRFAVVRGACAGGCGDLWVVDVASGRVSKPALGRTGKVRLAMEWRPDSAMLRAHWVAAGGDNDGECVVYSAVWDGGAFADEVEQAYGPGEACGWLGWGR